MLPRPAKSLQTSAEKVEHTGPAEKERVASVPQREQLTSTPEPSVQIVRREGVEVSESRTLARKRGIKAGAWRGKGGLHGEGRQVPRRRGRASKESLLRRSRRKHEGVSGRKSSPEGSLFYFRSGYTRNEKGGWETKGPLIR